MIVKKKTCGSKVHTAKKALSCQEPLASTLCGIKMSVAITAKFMWATDLLIGTIFLDFNKEIKIFYSIRNWMGNWWINIVFERLIVRPY